MPIEDCTFCSIVAGVGPPHEVIAESPGALAFMNVNPPGFGHALVIPKAHAENIWEVTDEDAAAVWSLTRRVADAALSTLHPEGLNLFQANGRAGWQSELHFHFHVVPRWAGDDIIPNWTEPKGERSRIADAAPLLRARFGQQATSDHE